MSNETQLLLEHFRTFGWVRIQNAFDADEAAAMSLVVWEALERTGILRNEPSTWTKTRPENLHT